MEQNSIYPVNYNMPGSIRVIIFSFLVVLMSAFSFDSFGQTDETNTNFEDFEELSDSTIVAVRIPAVEIKGSKKKSRRYDRKYKYYERRVVKVYPYAKAAGELMQSYDEELSKISNERDQKKFIKLAEAELTRQFEGDLRDMTISEGIILIKLIDRETGDSSYELIQDLKGGFSAYMWQGVARLFSHNLKNKYDPYDDLDDEVIEYIIDRIEFGFLDVEEKDVHALTAEMILKN